PATSGAATLRYDTSPVRYGVLALQAIFWLVAIRFARRSRRQGPVAATLTGTPSTPAPVAPAEPVVEPADWLAPAEEWPADPTPALLDELEPEPAPEPAPDEEDRP